MSTNTQTPVSISRLLRSHRLELVTLFFGTVAIHLVFLSRAFRGDSLDPTAASQFGEFIGGYIGTLLTLVSVLLLLATLRAQRQANQQEHFENKYFALIEMHRRNVAEMALPDGGAGRMVTGRRVFVLLIREFRSILLAVRSVAPQLDQTQAVHLAYHCLFFGVGPTSSRMLKSSLKGTFEDAVIAAVESELMKPATKDRARHGALQIDYAPFEGHQSRLGHYYRHLYQTVRYVDQQMVDIDKYDYVKTVRAQLSTHEQGLLLLNSLARLGWSWWRDDLLGRYRMVRNLPSDFFDEQTELNVRALFREHKGYFEWGADCPKVPTLQYPEPPGQ